MIIVSHDRHILASTCDDFYLVDQGKVEPFNGDLLDYEQWLAQSAKIEINKDTDVGINKKNNENSAQSRKDQKRLAAEFRQQTKPLRQKIEKLEKSVDKLQTELSEIEEQLSDAELYSAERKAELNKLLSRQADIKTQLEIDEDEWMLAEEELDVLQQAFEKK
jgi:ATP-binding cassette subfamily F protein 3